VQSPCRPRCAPAIAAADFAVAAQFGFDGIQGGHVGHAIDGFAQQAGGTHGGGSVASSLARSTMAVPSRAS
jgi:hypothetical protein